MSYSCEHSDLHKLQEGRSLRKRYESGIYKKIASLTRVLDKIQKEVTECCGLGRLMNGYCTQKWPWASELNWFPIVSLTLQGGRWKTSSMRNQYSQRCCTFWYQWTPNIPVHNILSTCPLHLHGLLQVRNKYLNWYSQMICKLDFEDLSSFLSRLPNLILFC